MDLTGIIWVILGIISLGIGLLYLIILLVTNAALTASGLPYQQRKLAKYFKTAVPPLAFGALFWIPDLFSSSVRYTLDDLALIIMLLSTVISIAWVIAIYRRSS